MARTEYKKKRNFAVTAEPSGGKPLPKLVKGASRFVIQKHAASRLHYDFRLEMAGVLKSWAVPKGLPWTQGGKRLAVEVEDHPVEYATFEGVIPQGQYGGGTVMLWDTGNYHVYGEAPLKAWKEGRLHLVLDGKKAKGEWALIRTRIIGDKPQWLLLKAATSLPNLSKKLDDQSVKTGRGMGEIADQRNAAWKSNRDMTRSPLKARIAKAASRVAATRSAGRVARAATRESAIVSALKGMPAAKAGFIEPMKPKLLAAPPEHGDWLYELKFDGIRVLAVKNGKKVSALSRNKNELGARFPEIVDAVGRLPLEDCVIDGEVVALDPEGRSSFQLLQNSNASGVESPVCYYVFDLLQANGKALTSLPLHRRKELLQGLCAGVSDPMRFSAEIGNDVGALLLEVKRRGLEGLIGKSRNSTYESGRRSGAWIKLKCVHEQEFVIGGYTPPAGARKHFGALLVGYFEGKRLLFAGKVGTGFNTKLLAKLHAQFQTETRGACPFADLPSKQGGTWVQGITPAMIRRCHWVNPMLVCQVKFAEWTRDLILRQPVFLGLREDKVAREVVRET